MKLGRILVVIFGVLAGVVGVALVIGGTAGLAFRLAFVRGEGFFSLGEVRLASGAYAIVSQTVGFGGGGPWWRGARPTLRVEVRPSDPGRALFVGVADRRDALAYLAGVAQDQVVDFALRGASLSYRSVPGGPPPEPPSRRPIWAAWAEGVGKPALTWEVKPGDWSVVVMNADGSPGVEGWASVGVRFPGLVPLAVGILLGGLVLVVLAVALIYVGATGRPLLDKRE